MIGAGSSLSGSLLAFAGVSSAVLLQVIDRGCISTDTTSVCATLGAESVEGDGWLMAGFPPFHLPRETFPYCREYYSVPSSWGKVIFNVDTWCLTGEKGEHVVCCNKAERYQGLVQRSPYARRGEGSELGKGSHQVSWEDAFPQTLKSYKELKSSSTDSVDQEALGLDFAPQQGVQIGGDSSVGNTETVASSNKYDASVLSDSSPDSELPPSSLQQDQDAANVFADIETPGVIIPEGAYGD